MKLYEESHAGWTTRNSTPPDGGIEIVDANGWPIATLHYDYRYTSNATNHFRAGLLSSAPGLFEYVKSSAMAGCATAKALVDEIERR